LLGDLSEYLADENWADGDKARDIYNRLE